MITLPKYAFIFISTLQHFKLSLLISFTGRTKANVTSNLTTFLAQMLREKMLKSQSPSLELKLRWFSLHSKPQFSEINVLDLPVPGSGKLVRESGYYEEGES